MLCFALDIGSLKPYLLILEMVQKKDSLITEIPFFLTLIHKMLLIMCHEITSVQPYLLLITKGIIFVTAGSCYHVT